MCALHQIGNTSLDCEAPRWLCHVSLRSVPSMERIAIWLASVIAVGPSQARLRAIRGRSDSSKKTLRFRTRVDTATDLLVTFLHTVRKRSAGLLDDRRVSFFVPSKREETHHSLNLIHGIHAALDDAARCGRCSRTQKTIIQTDGIVVDDPLELPERNL